jgi:hypothetical protein
VKASVAEQNPLGYALSGGAVSANINAAMAQQLLLTVVTSILFAAYPIATLIIINRRPASEFLRGASPPHSTSTENPMR